MTAAPATGGTAAAFPVTPPAVSTPAAETPAPPAAQSAATPATGVAWSLKRAGGRAFIGAIASSIAPSGYWLAGASETYDAGFYAQKNFEWLVLNAVWFTVIVGALEWFVKAVRIPDGGAYLAARGKPLVHSAIQGAVVMSVIGYLDFYSLSGTGPDPSSLYWLPIGGAVGWVVAETLLARTDRPASARTT